MSRDCCLAAASHQVPGSPACGGFTSTLRYWPTAWSPSRKPTYLSISASMCQQRSQRSWALTLPSGSGLRGTRPCVAWGWNLKNTLMRHRSPMPSFIKSCACCSSGLLWQLLALAGPDCPPLPRQHLLTSVGQFTPSPGQSRPVHFRVLQDWARTGCRTGVTCPTGCGPPRRPAAALAPRTPLFLLGPEPSIAFPAHSNSLLCAFSLLPISCPAQSAQFLQGTRASQLGHYQQACAVKRRVKLQHTSTRPAPALEQPASLQQGSNLPPQRSTRPGRPGPDRRSLAHHLLVSHGEVDLGEALEGKQPDAALTAVLDTQLVLQAGSVRRPAPEGIAIRQACCVGLSKPAACAGTLAGELAQEDRGAGCVQCWGRCLLACSWLAVA